MGRSLLPSESIDMSTDPRAALYARKLNEGMLAKGWSQAELARQAEKFLPKGQKMGRHLVSYAARGEHIPSVVNSKALADALGLNVKDLLPDPSVAGDPPPRLEIVGESARLKLDVHLPAMVALEIMRLVKEAA